MEENLTQCVYMILEICCAMYNNRKGLNTPYAMVYDRKVMTLLVPCIITGQGGVSMVRQYLRLYHGKPLHYWMNNCSHN